MKKTSNGNKSGSCTVEYDLTKKRLRIISCIKTPRRKLNTKTATDNIIIVYY